MNVYRISIANIDRHTLARRLSTAGLSGTVFPSLGFGAWGVEKGCTVEVATTREGTLFSEVALLLRERSEECAYFTVNGANARLIYPLEGTLTGWRFEVIR